MAIWCGFAAVSYTYLDVYKRQLDERSRHHANVPPLQLHDDVAQSERLLEVDVEHAVFPQCDYDRVTLQCDMFGGAAGQVPALPPIVFKPMRFKGIRQPFGMGAASFSQTKPLRLPF